MSFTFYSVPAVRPERRAASVSRAMSLGLSQIPAASGRLAVVGAGHSLAAYEETLRRWDGPIWATNGAFAWLKDRHIKSVFFAMHPTESILKHMEGMDPADTAMLALQCCPEVYDAAAQGARYVFDDQLFPGCGAPGHAAYQGIVAGFTEITFFGCDLSYADGKTHIEGTVNKPSMVVRAGGYDFMTTPAYYCQALEIRELVGVAPKIFRERSAGLLRALLDFRDEKVVWTSDDVKNMRDPGLLEFGFMNGIIDPTDPHVRTFTIGNLDNINIAAE